MLSDAAEKRKMALCSSQVSGLNTSAGGAIKRVEAINEKNFALVITWLS